VPGSKKQNLNHLLNFHYAPRDGVMPGSGHWRSSPPGLGKHNSARWLTYTHKHKYNKEQFLQAKWVARLCCDHDAYQNMFIVLQQGLFHSMVPWSLCLSICVCHVLSSLNLPLAEHSCLILIWLWTHYRKVDTQYQIFMKYWRCGHPCTVYNVNSLRLM
jgi:hypothetical protein